LSRGYGGQSTHYPLEVEQLTSPLVAGDEPVMIKQRIDVKVVIDPQRGRGAQYLVNNLGCNLIICDDGLQHYALQRDIELLVIDGRRKFGNELLMPFGPLREPTSRVQEVAAVIVNNPDNLAVEQFSDNFSMTLQPKSVIDLKILLSSVAIMTLSTSAFNAC